MNIRAWESRIASTIDTWVDNNVPSIYRFDLEEMRNLFSLITRQKYPSGLQIRKVLNELYNGKRSNFDYFIPVNALNIGMKLIDNDKLSFSKKVVHRITRLSEDIKLSVHIVSDMKIDIWVDFNKMDLISSSIIAKNIIMAGLEQEWLYTNLNGCMYGFVPKIANSIHYPLHVRSKGSVIGFRIPELALN